MENYGYYQAINSRFLVLRVEMHITWIVGDLAQTQSNHLSALRPALCSSACRVGESGDSWGHPPFPCAKHSSSAQWQSLIVYCVMSACQSKYELFVRSAVLEHQYTKYL